MNITVTDRARVRMAGLHFRIPRSEKAGNFIPGVDPDTLIDMFRSELEADIAEAIASDEDTFSVTYEAEMLIGWSSTDELEEIDQDTMEVFSMNHLATAWRYKQSFIGQADLTTEVTFVISILYNKEGALVQSMYPGRDVGKLEGDVSGREAVVFYDFDHMGEPLI